MDFVALRTSIVREGKLLTEEQIDEIKEIALKEFKNKYLYEPERFFLQSDYDLIVVAEGKGSLENKSYTDSCL